MKVRRLLKSRLQFKLDTLVMNVASKQSDSNQAGVLTVKGVYQVRVILHLL